MRVLPGAQATHRDNPAVAEPSQVVLQADKEWTEGSLITTAIHPHFADDFLLSLESRGEPNC